MKLHVVHLAVLLIIVSTRWHLHIYIKQNEGKNLDNKITCMVAEVAKKKKLLKINFLAISSTRSQFRLEISGEVANLILCFGLE